MRTGRRVVPLLAFLVFAILPLPSPGEQAPQPRLRILVSEDPPVNYYDADGQVAGMGADLVRRVAARLGTPAEIEVYPWIRALKIAQDEPNVLIVNAGITSERRQSGFTFIGPIVTLQNALYRRKDGQISVQSIGEVARRGIIVGGTRGDKRGADLRAQGVTMFQVASHVQHVKMLLDGRLDLTLLSDLQMAMCLKLLDREQQSVEPALPTDRQANYLMFSPRTDPALLAAWEARIKEAGASGYFAGETKKWSETLGVRIEHDAKRGYFIAPGSP